MCCEEQRQGVKGTLSTCGVKGVRNTWFVL